MNPFTDIIDPESLDYSRGVQIIKTEDGKLHFRPRWNCGKCQDSGSLPNGDTCPDCCPHDEKDHSICIDCGKDCFNDDVGAAEFRADCINDR